METGQIMAVLQQQPTGVASPQAGEAVLPAGRVDGAFAGLLQGMSMKKIVQAAVAEQAVPLNVSGLSNDVMSAFLTAAGNNEKQVLPDQADSAEVKAGIFPLQDAADPKSQNVMPGLNGDQIAQLFAQLQGRMPEAGSITGSRPESTREIPQADRNVTIALESAGQEQIRRDAPLPQAASAAIPAGSKDAVRTEGDTTVPAQVSVMASGREPVLAFSTGSKISTDLQNGPEVTERDKPADAPRTDVISSIPAERGGRQSEKMIRSLDVIPLVLAEAAEVPLVQVRDGLRVVTEMQQRQDSGPVVVAEPVVAAIASPQPVAAVVQPVTEMENSVSPSEHPAVQNRVATLPAASAAAISLQVPAQENELLEATALQPGMTGQQDQLQKVRSAGTIVSLPAAAFNAADGQSETVAVRLDQRETVKSPQSEQVVTAKIVDATPSGDAQTSSDEQETAERGMNGNFSSHVLHQQVKTEGSLTASSASGAAQNDTPRSALPPEQVVQQVRDRFVNHETKPGSEQIVLRLAPEHLGELKVNLNLEGQRLKVEIVAENRMVRDSLMQHTDALKESLSRQNIKMESFEVTTGGNGASDGSRGQGNWRELAQQRQHNAWMPDGGYRLAAQTAPAIAAYQMKSEHTMVDLHF